MTELEPVEPDAVLPARARGALDRWPATGPSGSRPVLAARVRALPARALLPVSALAVTAVAAARVAVRVVRLARRAGGPVARDVSGRSPGPPAVAATWVQVSWTHVEVRAGSPDAAGPTSSPRSRRRGGAGRVQRRS